MPTISRENMDALHAVITLELPKSDYLPQVEQKLKDQRKKAHLKGFRPGQVPMGFFRAKFGNSILNDEIQEIVGKELDGYFKAENIKYLGQPLPITTIDININKPQDFLLQFEIGLEPQYEIEGISLDNVLPYFDVQIDDEAVDKEVEQLRKRFASGFEDDILDIKEGDMLVVDLQELTEEGQEKEGGHSREEVTVFVNDIKNAELKDQLFTATVGDKFEVNPYDLDKGNKETVDKYLLDVKAGQVVGDKFRMTIRSIRRTKLADLSPEFYKQIFPDANTTPAEGEEEVQAPDMDLESFRERIREEIYKAYRRSVRFRFYRTVHKSLMELNKFDLPVAFLKKWLNRTRGVSEQDFEAGYEEFSYNTRWSMMRDKLAERFGVEVTKDELEWSIRMEIVRYFNYQVGPYSEVVTKTLERVTDNKQEMNRRYENMLDERVLEHVAEEVGKDVKVVSRQEFEAMLEEERKAEEKEAAMVENTENTTEVTAEAQE